uniref:Doublecortin domain-containing protein n=1 Tax=Salarias fasciatus TaxID=181472 RepID=A0A672GF19_SALFA
FLDKIQITGPMSDSGQTLPSKPLQHVSDASASKRVCFYKSGDYKFSGHRMVVNGRIFKTFDALLDALSKKVPLPFGVRTITTPRGTHLIKALDELHDGGAYVCSDQKRVKPLNLDEVTRRQVPWNTTRPLSVGQSEATGRPAKMAERVAVRTPKRLTVIKNKDPTVKRTIVLQRRTAPTFDALLDYLSQILQFPVLRLYATDGRRVSVGLKKVKQPPWPKLPERCLKKYQIYQKIHSFTVNQPGNSKRSNIPSPNAQTVFYR